MGTVKDAQNQLRHADAQTTMNVYQKSIPASVSAADRRPYADQVGFRPLN